MRPSLTVTLSYKAASALPWPGAYRFFPTSVCPISM